MSSTPEANRQAGVAIGSTPAEEGQVAHGDRREEAHYEADPDHIATVKFTEKPAGPLPPEEQSGAYVEGRGFSDSPPIQDVAVSAGEQSVWDARPPEDDQARNGNPTGR